MNKTVKRLITGLVILLVVGIIAWPKISYLFEDAAQKASAERAASEALKASATPVNAVVVVPQTLDDKIEVNGEILANESLELKSEISGKVTNIFFQEGQQVRKGELLLTINDNELRAQLEKVKYTKKLVEDNEYRQRKLLEREAISQEEYDQALTELNTSIADIKLIEAQIAKSQIRAPFDGVVGLRYVSEGSYISPQNVIATLSNLDPAKIEFSIPSKYSTNVGVGDDITFSTEGIGQNFSGKIYAIEPKIDPATRTMKLRAISPNPDNRLLPGQYTRVDVILNSTDSALMVPSEAVIPTFEGHSVFVHSGGKAEKRNVEIGIRTRREVEIKEGLAYRDTVITSGLLQIKDGSKVTLKEVDNTPLNVVANAAE